MIEKLISHDLISRADVLIVEDLISRNGSKSNYAYIHGLFDVEFQKLTGKRYSPFFQFHFGNSDISSEKQNEINSGLDLYLNKLLNTDLISKAEFYSFREKIRTNSYSHLIHLLSDIGRQSQYSDWMSPKNVIPFAETLLNNRVLTQESFDKLKNDLEAGKIEYHHQLLEYCENAALFDLTQFSNDPEIYIEEIHKKVAGVFPELSYSKFKFEIKVDETNSFDDYISHKLVVSLTSNGKSYKQKSFISPNDIGKDGNYLGKIDEQEFYQIFNKILADRQSPWRLHLVKYNAQHGGAAHRYFGIIALKEEQTEMFRFINQHIEISYENFKNTLSSSRINAAIKEYKKLGLLDHLKETQIKESIEKVKENENRSLNDVIRCFPEVVHSYDMELSNLEDPYAELLREYSRISHGDFDPVETSDNFELNNETVDVKFKLKEKKYEWKLRVENDWMDTEFSELVNDTVKECGLKGSFYYFFDGQYASVIYLTKSQYEQIKDRALLVFEDANG